MMISKYKIRELIDNSTIFVTAFLFLYTGIKKILNSDIFFQSLLDSPLIPNQLIYFVYILVPLLELVASYFLIFDKKRTIVGLYLSTLLLCSFSLYLLLLVIMFDSIPCGCGGFLELLSTEQHIALNLGLLVLNVRLLIAGRKRKWL